MSGVMTIRVDRRTRARLAKLAKATERAESELLAEAIRSYVDVKEWQVESIEAATVVTRAAGAVIRRAPHLQYIADAAARLRSRVI